MTIQCCGSIKIGKDVLFGSNIFICDYNHGMDPQTEGGYVNNELEVGCVEIQDKVWIGQNCIILPNVCIGSNSIVGAGSVVTHDVPPYTMVAGNPARIIKEYNMEKAKWVNYNE